MSRSENVAAQMLVGGNICDKAQRPPAVTKRFRIVILKYILCYRPFRKLIRRIAYARRDARRQSAAAGGLNQHFRPPDYLSSLSRADALCWGAPPLSATVLVPRSVDLFSPLSLSLSASPLSPPPLCVRRLPFSSPLPVAWFAASLQRGTFVRLAASGATEARCGSRTKRLRCSGGPLRVGPRRR